MVSPQGSKVKLVKKTMPCLPNLFRLCGLFMLLYEYMVFVMGALLMEKFNALPPIANTARGERPPP